MIRFEPEDPPHCAPLVHPARDPLTRRARLSAILLCGIAGAGVLAAALVGAMRGEGLDPLVLAVVATAGIVVASRLPLLTEILLGILDRAEALENAPDSADVLRRLALGVLAPWLLSFLAVMRLRDPAETLAVLLLILLAEAAYRLGGMSRWRGTPLETDVLKAVFTDDLDRGLMAITQAKHLTPREFEANTLAVEGMALGRENRHAIGLLLGVARRRLERTRDYSLPEREVERTVLILEADLARLQDAEGAVAEEAKALRALGPGHPRRLALALFVATSALEIGQPEAALKALRRLHAREVVTEAGRLLVNWLLSEAAHRAGDLAMREKAERAMKTFNVRRIASTIAVDELKGGIDRDPYARWIVRARDALIEARDAK
ncbi:MAG: hypothetical protein SF028_05070 [Candidatus Sumerlaeia bacterium]|nr:hypothetical protein [Candidatus Sumerlaeia bacterium]